MTYATIQHPNARTTILRLDSAQTMYRENTPVETPEAVRAFLADHPEVQAVSFGSTHMPRRPVDVEKVTDAMLHRWFNPPKVRGYRIDVR